MVCSLYEDSQWFKCVLSVHFCFRVEKWRDSSGVSRFKMKAQTGSGDDVGLEDSSQRENQSDSSWQENQPIRANASSSSVASAYFNNKITIPEDQQVPPGEGEE